MSLIKTTAQAAAIAVLGLLALRGATAFYSQWRGPETTEPPQQAAAAAPAPVLASKAERLARASALVAGMGKSSRATDVFSAPDGSTGVVIEAPEGRFVAWMVDGVPALFVGAKFDPRGRNLTQDEMFARKFARPSDTPPTGAAPAAAAGGQGASSAGLLQAVEQSAGFVEGSAGPVWTAYIDPNCTFCTQLWRNLRAPIAAGQIRVRWAPVAVIAPDSAARAATLLQASRPLEVLAEHGLTGRAVPAAGVSVAARQQLEANNAMLRALSGGQAPATPTLVVPGRGAPQIVRGLPPNLEQLLAQP